MPIFDIGCVVCRRVKEHYISRSDSPNPPCEHGCEGDTVRLIGRFAVVRTGVITSKYNDKSLEGGYADGHWMTRKRAPDGTLLKTPEPVFIETFQQQKDFSRSEGLVSPWDAPVGEASSDRTMSSAGMPGSWV